MTGLSIRLRAHQSGNPRRSGMALVLSLVLVLVCASLGAAFAQFASSTARQQTHAVAQLKAFYVAEAGLAESFYAVRMGRTGRIADETVPARYGGAQVWVETSEAADGTLFIRSTARQGRSEAALGLIVAPEPPPLGFFAVEDLVISDVILVDGFDSTERSYHEEVAAVEAQLAGALEAATGSYTAEEIASFENARALAPTFVEALGFEIFESVLANQISIEQETSLLNLIGIGEAETVYVLYFDPHDLRELLSPTDYDLFINNGRDIYDTFVAGHLFNSDPLVPGFEGTTGLLGGILDAGSWLDYDPTAPERLEGHTLKGALIGSSGDVVFEGAAADAEIHGSVTPGVDGAVFGLAEGAVTGSTSPRALPPQLPEVDVPSLTSEGDRIVDTGLPTVISLPTVRYDRLEVGVDEELVLRGPMQLVVDDFVVADGASLELDTSLGEVEVFVRSSMSMSPTSLVQTTGGTSRDVSIQAESGVADSALEMRAAGAFSGTIYAPDSEVTIGTNFEVFGGVVARRLVIESGARLHFDDETYDGQLAVPTMEAWRVLDLPPQATGAAPPTIGLQADLAAMHDTSLVSLDLTYVDANGATQSYSGAESAFDYSTVAEVTTVRRDVDHDAVQNEPVPEWMTRWSAAASEGGTDFEDWLNDLLAAWAASQG